MTSHRRKALFSVLARFGPLALGGSAPKIFVESLVTTPTLMQNFGPIGLVVLQIIDNHIITIIVSPSPHSRATIPDITVHPHLQCSRVAETIQGRSQATREGKGIFAAFVLEEDDDKEGYFSVATRVTGVMSLKT